MNQIIIRAGFLRCHFIGLRRLSGWRSQTRARLTSPPTSIILLISVVGCILPIPNSSKIMRPATRSLNVLSLNGVHIRGASNAKSKSLGIAPYGSSIEIVDTAGIPAEYNGIPGEWREVVGPVFHGYVFDGFLSTLPTPPTSCSSLEDYVKSRLTAQGASRRIALTTKTDASGNRTVVEVPPYNVPAHDDPDYSLETITPLNQQALFNKTQYWEALSEELVMPMATARDLFLISRICVGPTWRDQAMSIPMREFFRPKCLDAGSAVTIRLESKPTPKLSHFYYYNCPP